VGVYTISVQMPGFQRATAGHIELHAGTKARIDFRMTLGLVTESVEVRATASLVNATTTDLGVVIDSRKVRDLPLNGRTFTQLLALEPGFNLGTIGANRGGVQFNGLPGLGNNWTLDGTDMSFGENNGAGISAVGGSGTVINTIGIEAIEEFKTSSGAFSAEYGRGTAGAINIITSSRSPAPTSSTARCWSSSGTTGWMRTRSSTTDPSKPSRSCGTISSAAMLAGRSFATSCSSFLIMRATGLCAAATLRATSRRRFCSARSRTRLWRSG
jgi:hypothetical protein